MVLGSPLTASSSSILLDMTNDGPSIVLNRTVNFTDFLCFNLIHWYYSSYCVWMLHGPISFGKSYVQSQPTVELHIATSTGWMFTSTVGQPDTKELGLSDWESFCFSHWSRISTTQAQEQYPWSMWFLSWWSTMLGTEKLVSGVTLLPP